VAVYGFRFPPRRADAGKEHDGPCPRHGEKEKSPTREVHPELSRGGAPGPGSGMTRLPSSEDAVPFCVPSNHAAIRPITA
jgi:hypothetical protein